MTLDEQPLLIAHRAGNHLHALDPAAAAGAQIIEIDVWFHRGRVEVGHDKTLGPIPLRWDRWSLAFGRRRKHVIRDILERFPPDAKPMFDLKGRDPRLPAALKREIEEHFPGRSYTVNSQNWAYLEAFIDTPLAHVFRSIGSREMLERMRGDLRHWNGAGIGLHQDLLTPPVIEELRAATPLIMTWTVNEPDRAAELIRRGVRGIITDSLDLIRALREETAAH